MAGCATNVDELESAPAPAKPLAEQALVQTGGAVETATFVRRQQSVPDEPDVSTDGRGRAASIFSCSDICAATAGAAFAGCGTFSFTGMLAGAGCGFATNRLCQAVCESQGPTSHCSEHAGGKACMNRDRFWWCDGALDGRKVRARYELEDPSEPGVVHTAWAPSQGCIAVRWPTAGLVQRWQVCTEGLGCSDWFYPNHHDATLSSYTPSGTPPSIEPPESPDVTPPAVWVGGTDPNSYYVGNIPIVATASDTESEIASMTVYVNEQPIYQVAGGALSFTWDSTGYNGRVGIKVAATDGAGNTAFTWYVINVANRPPSVDLHVPNTVSSQVYFFCTVNGSTPLTRTIYVDGTPVDDGGWGWDSRSVADGTHTVACRATDTLGRTADGSGQFYVYNHPGGMSWLSPSFGVFTGTPEEPRVELQAAIDETDLDMGEIYEDGQESTPLCRAPHDPNVHAALILDCAADYGVGNRGLNILGRSDGVYRIWMHGHTHNDYQMTTGDYWYSRTLYVDNTAPVIQLDAANTYFVDQDGVRYVHMQAITPTAFNVYATHPDSISTVEFFATLPDGTQFSLGAVTSEGYPWTLTQRVPDDALIDGTLTLTAVATDTVSSHRDTPTHRTGTSAPLDLTIVPSEGATP